MKSGNIHPLPTSSGGEKKHSHSEQHLGKTPPSVNLYQKSYVGLISTNPSLHFYNSVIPNIRGKPYSWEEAPARGALCADKACIQCTQSAVLATFPLLRKLEKQGICHLFTKRTGAARNYITPPRSGRKSTSLKRDAEFLGGKRSL